MEWFKNLYYFFKTPPEIFKHWLLSFPQFFIFLIKKNKNGVGAILVGWVRTISGF